MGTQADPTATPVTHASRIASLDIVPFFAGTAAFLHGTNSAAASCRDSS